MEIATKERWKTIPMTQPRKIGVSILLNTEQLKKLRIGLVPNEMED